MNNTANTILISMTKGSDLMSKLDDLMYKLECAEEEYIETMKEAETLMESGSCDTSVVLRATAKLEEMNEFLKEIKKEVEHENNDK